VGEPCSVIFYPLPMNLLKKCKVIEEIIKFLNAHPPPQAKWKEGIPLTETCSLLHSGINMYSTLSNINNIQWC
jgi:hypothetical protein